MRHGITRYRFAAVSLRDVSLYSHEEVDRRIYMRLGIPPLSRRLYEGKSIARLNLLATRKETSFAIRRVPIKNCEEKEEEEEEEEVRLNIVSERIIRTK